MGIDSPINYAALYQKAVDIATAAHEGQTRWDPSVPYITHPLAVADNFDLDKDQGPHKILAVLHDVIEDTSVTAEQLLDVFPDWIIKSIVALTHLPDESYADYICRVNDDCMAAAVKMADLKDNLKDLTKKKHLQRIDKYQLALKLLETKWG
jgi:(p)ppGpp synthase/HD superfamily hydrolase